MNPIPRLSAINANIVPGIDTSDPNFETYDRIMRYIFGPMKGYEDVTECNVMFAPKLGIVGPHFNSPARVIIPAGAKVSSPIGTRYMIGVSFSHNPFSTEVNPQVLGLAQKVMEAHDEMNETLPLRFRKPQYPRPGVRTKPKDDPEKRKRCWILGRRRTAQ